MDIIQGVAAILKYVGSLQSLGKEPPKEWSTVKATLSRITQDEDGHAGYQCIDLSNFTPAMLTSCFTERLSDLKKLDAMIKKRLSWSDASLLWNVIFLDTRSWIRLTVNMQMTMLN